MRHASSWAWAAQRDFISGCSLLRNVLDIDLAARKVSLKSNAGALILFDFRAAFLVLCLSEDHQRSVFLHGNCLM